MKEVSKFWKLDDSHLKLNYVTLFLLKNRGKHHFGANTNGIVFLYKNEGSHLTLCLGPIMIKDAQHT